MLQSFFWEANSFLASQEIPRSLGNTKVHYRCYKSLLSLHILRQINSIHASVPLLENPLYYYPHI
jgi:hypothetical protein